MTREPELCIILGRKIGTYTGYHLIDTILKVRNLQPDPSIPSMPSGDVVFDFDWGTIRSGETELDMIDILSKAPKADLNPLQPRPPSTPDKTSTEIQNDNPIADPDKPSTTTIPAPLPKL